MNKGTKITTEEIIKRFKKKHANAYDYSLFEYKTSETKSTIICNRCGDQFKMNAHSHLKGKGCPDCFGRRMDNRIFRKRANITHGEGMYDYSRVDYIDCNTHVEIWCPRCKKSFYQSPRTHIQGRGCKSCQGTMAIGIEEFTRRMEVLAPGKFDYSEAIYTNGDEHITLICKKCGSKVSKTPKCFYSSPTCPACHPKNRKLRRNQKWFLEKSISSHEPNAYDYSKAVFKGVESYVRLKCNTCGHEFEQLAGVHTKGHGCPKCALMKKYPDRVLGTEKFIERAISIFGKDKFDYSKVDYKYSNEKVCVICKECGNDFWVTPSNHTGRESGCPICAKKYRKTQNQIQDFLKENIKSELIVEDKTILYDKTTKHFKELDFYFPSLKKAIEFNGDYWHELHEEVWKKRHPGTTTTYHEFKILGCQERGIELMNIDYWEWAKDRERTKEHILNFLSS